jgi:hypothetical protein
LAISLIREIGRTDPKDYVRDGAGADNVGRFLVELADRLPKHMSTNLGVLIPHFGGESYKIRNSLVGVFGKLAAKAFKDVGVPRLATVIAHDLAVGYAQPYTEKPALVALTQKIM